MARIPLGWMQLKREKLRFAVALAGVAFAVILILMQLGFQDSLYESAVRYHKAMVFDLVLISPESSFIARPEPFSQRRLYKALEMDGVTSVHPVYATQGNWKDPYEHQTRMIFVMGFDPAHRVFELPGVVANLDAIKLRDGVLFDSASRPEYGPVAQDFRPELPIVAQLNNHEIQVRGLFELGTSFGIDGSILTSDTNFLRFFPDRQRGLIDLGLIRLRSGSHAVQARDALRARLPGDVLVMTKAEYMQREKAYWASATAIGYIFGFGLVVGLVVGGIVVYQILFADVSDHLAEYATLKAMGYSDRYLSGVVLQQATILAVLGYLPAFAGCVWLYRLVGEATHLPLEMTVGRGVGVVALTIGMCSLAGLLALRKVRSADPAEIF